MGRFCVVEVALWICSSLPSAVCKHMRVNSRNTKDYFLDWDMIVFGVDRSVLIRVALIVRDLFPLPFGIACRDGIQLQITRSDTDFIQRRVDLQTHDGMTWLGGTKTLSSREVESNDLPERGQNLLGECQCESRNERTASRSHVNCTSSCELK